MCRVEHSIDKGFGSSTVWYGKSIWIPPLLKSAHERFKLKMGEWTDSSISMKEDNHLKNKL